MIRNRELVSRAKQFARKQKTDDSDRTLQLIDRYEAACGLSLGPDPSRSAAWERNATERRSDLSRAMGEQD
jgi:hypothetical protein